MIYIPDPKSLVYSELQFISTSVSMPQAKISLEIEKIYDSVSAEIFALFVGIDLEDETDLARDYVVPMQVAYGIEIAN